MRSHEERVAETKRRIAKMEREKRLRRNTVTARIYFFKFFENFWGLLR